MNKKLPSDFFELITTHEKPVLVDFWAEWCGPCRMVAPVLKQLAGEWKDRLTVVKVNTDEKPEIAGRFGISAIPTMILFDKGKEALRLTGAMSLEQMKNRLSTFVN